MQVVAKRMKCAYCSEWNYYPSLLSLRFLVYMMVSFIICKLSPNGDTIYRGQILSTSHSKVCWSPVAELLIAEAPVVSQGTADIDLRYRNDKKGDLSSLVPLSDELLQFYLKGK
jgi:hypothetical protein